jgi:hypothetical protein
MGLWEGYLYLALLALGVLGIGRLVASGAGRLFAAQAHLAGIVAIWAVVGLLAVLAAPDLGYPLVWPALVGTVVLIVSAPSRGWWWSSVRLWMVGALVLVLVVPPIDTFFQLAQPRPGNPDSELIPIIIIPTALLVLAIETIRRLWADVGTTPEAS